MNAITIARDEAIILAQALNEVCNGPDSIDGREFHTRMGATVSEGLIYFSLDCIIVLEPLRKIQR